MFILDTNAFYYAAGISNTSFDVRKLHSIINNNMCFISSTSFFEFIIKYRTDKNTICKGYYYLRENKIRIVGNVLNPLPENFANRLEHLLNDEPSKLFEEILENKISVESRFIALLFDICLFSGYYFSLMAEGKDPSFFSYKVMQKVFRFFNNINTELFEGFFKKGYEIEDCENYIRKCFYCLLALELEKGVPFIERSKDVSDKDPIPFTDQWAPQDDIQQEFERLNERLSRKTSTAYLQRMAVKYWKTNNDPELKRHMSIVKSMFDSIVEYPALQDYFYDTLVDVLTHGAALWKNDFLDALIMCSIQDTHVLITYDRGVIERLEKRKKEHKMYDVSLKTITWLSS